MITTQFNSLVESKLNKCSMWRFNFKKGSYVKMWESVKKSWKGADQKSPGWQGQSVMDMLTGSQGIVGWYEAWVSQDW